MSIRTIPRDSCTKRHRHPTPDNTDRLARGWDQPGAGELLGALLTYFRELRKAEVQLLRKPILRSGAKGPSMGPNKPNLSDPRDPAPRSRNSPPCVPWQRVPARG